MKGGEHRARGATGKEKGTGKKGKAQLQGRKEDVAPHEEKKVRSTLPKEDTVMHQAKETRQVQRKIPGRAQCIAAGTSSGREEHPLTNPIFWRGERATP